MSPILACNLYYLSLLKRIFALREAGEHIPNSLLQHTLDFGEKIGIPLIELAVLESIDEKTTFH